jgi:AraC-like DNA-binding protein
MGSSEYKPTEQLRDYIDAYYTVQRDPGCKPSSRRIYADGCTDLVANIGTTVPFIDQRVPLMPGHLYLGGTMTCSTEITTLPGTVFVGIRFKPGGFNVFYKIPIFEIVDDIVDFPDHELLSLLDIDKGLTDRLDAYFLRRWKQGREDIFRMTKDIYQFKGQITVDNLARKYFVSNRTLERLFKFNVGINPKEFIKIVRFQEVLKKLQKETSRESLLRIAFETGYYDHAHLTNEFKRYSGLNPTDIMPRGF